MRAQSRGILLRAVCVCLALLLASCTTLRPEDTALLRATANGDRNAADAALQQGANVNAADPGGWTPLMFAARSGDAATARELLRRGAKVNAVNANRETALMVADPKVTQLLLDNGAGWGGPDGTSALMMTSDVEKTRVLLAAGAPVDAANALGSTALWYAAFRGEKDRVRMLLNAGADAKHDNGGTNALMAAAGSGDADSVRLLLGAGADVRTRDFNGLTPLHWAAKNLRHGVVEAVLAGKPDVNGRANDGRTPLMMATQDGYTENVRILLAAGADPNVRSAAGQTPLQWAAAKGNQDLVALLSGAGARGAPAGSIDDLEHDAKAGGLEVFATDVTTDGRHAKIRGRVSNHYQERVEGVRFEVLVMTPDGSRPLDTLRSENATIIEAGDHAPLRLDLESMYFGNQAKLLVRALPVKVGGRELPVPAGWTP